MITFNDLNLHEDILKAIADLGFQEPSKIQKAAIPDLLEGKDMLAQAQTGTGKTLAFASVILGKIAAEQTPGLKALILAPTRELALQIAEELERLGKYLFVKSAVVYGGSDIRQQIKTIKNGVDIVVGTPGRVMDLMRKKVLDLTAIEYAVLDEADEMLNMGFIEDIETILKDANPQRQTMLFSATLPASIQTIARKYMKSDAKKVIIKEKSTTASTVEQFYFEIRQKERYEALCRLLDGYGIKTAIIFCKTKKSVDELSSQMVKSGYHVESMHGDLSQESRLETLKRFKNGKLPYLVATDVAARGIDVKNISHVINYELPQDTESYVHRIGRTGRASAQGQALTLVTRQEKRFLKEVEKIHRTEILPAELPPLKKIMATQIDLVIDEIEDTMHAGKHKTYLQELNQMSHQDLVNVAASLFYLQASSHLGFDYTQETIGYAKAAGTIFLELGPNFALNPGMVLKYLIDVGRLHKEDIGRIEIESRGAKVELTNDRALHLAKSRLPDTRLAGRKVRVKTK